jgi:hypothetical protein
VLPTKFQQRTAVLTKSLEFINFMKIVTVQNYFFQRSKYECDL